jgi:hypothetical protein
MGIGRLRSGYVHENISDYERSEKRSCWENNFYFRKSQYVDIDASYDGKSQLALNVDY